MNNHIKTVTLIILLLIFSSILFYSNILIYPINCNTDYILSIEKNDTASDVGKSLSENHCINSTIFKIAVYSTFNQYNIKPGLYSLKDVHTNTDIIKLITSNTKDRKRFTIYEGWSIDQIAEKLSAELSIDKHKFINLCKNKSFISSIGIPYDIETLEGFLYPDTYTFLSTYNEEDVLNILTKRFFEIYNNYIYPISFDTNLNVLEIISLGSIIQAEAMIIDEMPIISSVYHNRLNKKIKLEADPTILYFMQKDDLDTFKNDPRSKESIRIFRSYKSKNNPYNTYLNHGLIPGPINNPGLDALKAAILPAKTEKIYLYFVANGSGGHNFSETLKQHKASINKIRYGY